MNEADNAHQSYRSASYYMTEFLRTAQGQTLQHKDTKF